METAFDSRFPTRNTNLAACLAALRIPIKHNDPVYVVEQGESSTSNLKPQTSNLPRTVTYFFEEQSAPNNDGYAIEQATHVDWAWRNRDKFEAENTDHPLVHMRKAIDKLEWLIKVKHGQITPSSRESSSNTIGTHDILLAACVMGSGHELHSIGTTIERGRETDFFLLNISEPEFERITEEFSCHRHGKDPVCYMRKALEARKELIALVKRAPVLLRYQNGEKEGFIPKDCSAEKLNQFFELLYE